MIDFWKSMAGMLELELTSADPAAAFHAVNEQNISVFYVSQVSDLTARFLIFRKDYERLAKLCEKRGETLQIRSRRGLYWSVKGLFGRPLLLLGLAVFLAMCLYLPTRVLFVRVEGNTTIPSNRILAAAEESGICFGASRREVRSEKMKNALLSAVPELQWAGVNTSGCVAVISVRERTMSEQEEIENSVSSIVAGRDGVIYSCTVTQGTNLCTVGQAVKEGQVLISGYTDCGICIQATRAEGEIYAQTVRDITAVSPSECLVKGEITNTSRKFSILLGKKRINLWKGSGIWDTTCGRMYKEYYITLPGGFQLPFGLAVEEYTFRETADSVISQERAEESLKDFANGYITARMVAGNILVKKEQIVLESGIYRMDGNYICTEMIGRVQKEQIGE